MDSATDCAVSRASYDADLSDSEKPDLSPMGNDASNLADATGSDVTRILDAAQKGDPNAAAELLPLVYDELRKLAAAKMAQERPGQTLQPTALVHEAWLRLAGEDKQRWDGRAHFFGAAAEAMRRILIDRARRRAAARHG